MIPYSIAEIESKKIQIDSHALLKSWGYSDMEIAQYEMWMKGKKKRIKIIDYGESIKEG